MYATVGSSAIAGPLISIRSLVAVALHAKVDKHISQLHTQFDSTTTTTTTTTTTATATTATATTVVYSLAEFRRSS